MRLSGISGHGADSLIFQCGSTIRVAKVCAANFSTYSVLVLDVVNINKALTNNILTGDGCTIRRRVFLVMLVLQEGLKLGSSMLSRFTPKHE